MESDIERINEKTSDLDALAKELSDSVEGVTFEVEHSEVQTTDITTEEPTAESPSKPSDLNIRTTSLKYSEKEVAGKCKEEFGIEWQMAEWEEIKAGVTPEMLDTLNILFSKNEKYYFVKNDGAEWYSQRRHYFVERHNQFVSSNNDPAPSNWLVHDEVG